MTNSKLTDELSGFYAAYSAWVNAGAQPGKIFGRANGLCVNAYDYFSAIGVDSKPYLEAMHAAFVAAGLDEKLPFNASPKQYAQEQRSVGCYLNPARLAWVASALQERRKADSAVPVAWSARDVRNDELSLYSLIDDVNAALSENQYLEVTPLSAASHPTPVIVAECEICGKSCTNASHPMKAVAVEPPISAEFKAARNTLKFLNYTWTGGEHWRPPLGLPPESVTGIDYKKLVEEISRIVFGNIDHVEHLPIVIRATFGRYQSCP